MLGGSETGSRSLLTVQADSASAIILIEIMNRKVMQVSAREASQEILQLIDSYPEIIDQALSLLTEAVAKKVPVHQGVQAIETPLSASLKELD